LEPAINPSRTLRPILANAPGRQHRLAPLAWPKKPLGDPVDEQVDDGVLRKIAFAEILVFGPQPFGDLAHRRPRQKPSARLVGERVLDVARRQTACVEFRRQPFEFPRASRQRRAHAREERLGRVANLRRGVFDCALRRLHPARPIAVAVARLFALAAFIALAAESVADLALQRFFDNQPQRQADQIAPSGRRPQVSVHQGATLPRG
jgi:hypothetical protein